MKYKVKKIKANYSGQYPNPWEVQSGGYQYPGYQPMDSYDYQSPYEPVTQPIAPQGEMQVTQSTMNQQQPSGNNMGQKIGSMAAGFGRAAGQALNALMVGGPQLINAMLPEQEVYREDRSLPRTYNPFPQGTGSQAIYKDGGKVAKNGYRTKKRKQGNIQIEEEVPIEDLPMMPMSYQIPFVPQQVPLPEVPEAREISFERLADVSGNPATYVPQFQGYNYFEALQALRQLPEFIDNIPVTRSPQLYQDLFQNFQPNTQASQWVPYQSDYYPQPLTPFENGGTIEPKFMKGYAESGIHIKPSKRGTFTKAAKERGMGVQEFASKVMANKENYSSAMVKKANFARVFGGRNYQNGGIVEGQELELDDAEILQLIQQGYEIEF